MKKLLVVTALTLSAWGLMAGQAKAETTLWTHNFPASRVDAMLYIQAKDMNGGVPAGSSLVVGTFVSNVSTGGGTGNGFRKTAVIKLDGVTGQEDWNTSLTSPVPNTDSLKVLEIQNVGDISGDKRDDFLVVNALTPGNFFAQYTINGFTGAVIEGPIYQTSSTSASTASSYINQVQGYFGNDLKDRVRVDLNIDPFTCTAPTCKSTIRATD